MDNSVLSSPFTTPAKSGVMSHVVMLLALAGLLLLVNLGGLGLTDRDEGSNAEAAREMLETGDWVSPTLNYEPRFAKPAFVYWIISTSYAVFGVNEFSARLPSALFGIGLILLQYGFLVRVCGARVALFGALILLLNLEVIGISRMVLTDPELCVFYDVGWLQFLARHGRRAGKTILVLWVLYRNGVCDACERPGGNHYSALGGYSLPHRDETMEAVLEERLSHFGHPSFHLVGRALVYRDVHDSWGRLSCSGTSEYDWTVCKSHGGSWWDYLFLYPNFAYRVFPLERLFTYAAVS